MADRRDLRDPRDLRASALANIGPADNPEMVAIAFGLLYIGDQIGRLAACGPQAVKAVKVVALTARTVLLEVDGQQSQLFAGDTLSVSGLAAGER